ncbi:TPA: DUF1983 domain-containing protein [Escherichia coli]|nr:DUF1983 domain-containing protein [Escherichia coli]
MEVNKKQLADIFGASIRTIQNWQEQGMPVLRGGGKGNEVLYDSAAVIKWYAERDAEIENEKLRREVEELRQASEADLQPGTIEYERHRLTRAQADAQELKNARDSAEVVETAFCTFVLSRIAGEIASILDGIPLSVQRRFPELENRHVDFLKRDIIKAMNKAAALDELITESHLGKELLEKVDLTEDNASRLEEFSKEWKDANDKWNAMWGVKIEQTEDGKHYVAGLGLSMEDTEEGKLSQFLVAANRIAFIDPANGNETPMFVAQGNQIFMNDVFLKRLTAPTITSGGSPPVFSLTSDGKLTAKNADISGSVNANSGTLNNVTINENCQIKGKLSANQIEGDIVKTVSKSFPRTNSYASGTITVRISDDQKFDRQVMIPPVLFRGGKHENFNSNNQQSYWYSTCRLRVTLNGQEIFNQSTTDAQGVFSSVIDMPAGQGTLTLTFTVSSSGANN